MPGRDAGFSLPDSDDDLVDWDTGVIAGSGIGGMDTIAQLSFPWLMKAG
jgi:3-oxoacyl-(acyl-carrier-protein) synthase